MINFCALILYLNAAASACTVLFHTLVLLIGWYRSRHYNKSNNTIDTPRPFIAYTQVSITGCILVLALWIVAFVVAVQLTIQGPDNAKPFAAQALWSNAIHIAILFLIGCVCLAKGLYLHMCFLERRRFFDASSSAPVDQERGSTAKPLPPPPEKHLLDDKTNKSMSSFFEDEDEETEKGDKLSPLPYPATARQPMKGRAVIVPPSLASKVRVHLKKPSELNCQWAFVTPTKQQASGAGVTRGSIVRESALWD
ncbi:hypothetical protein CVT24_010346 [Panaeolus cyanescens]|uniref:Uncharacterized protein n=1 Tax=Panaeolus cyanescens TaxID=181874 RepID=A0A409YQG4_9AGAR|nr:hypothetical protein CVT24_010346 [Panaeolus cyanescens]